jgi:hypothetical protein
VIVVQANIARWSTARAGSMAATIAAASQNAHNGSCGQPRSSIDGSAE